MIEIKNFKGEVLKTVDAADLNGADLNGAYLTDAYLTRANLNGAYLTDANLTSAYLTRANLTSAYLTRAYLNGANLTCADLRGTDLTGANLRDANLTGTDLTGANLRGANLGFPLTQFQVELAVRGACGEARTWVGRRSRTRAWKECPHTGWLVFMSCVPCQNSGETPDEYRARVAMPSVLGFRL